jgi:AcrR family transcriptional regulator
MGAATGTRKQQAARTEAALKEAALRVFERVGYLNAKITDITAEAGRAAGSFYTHFAGKEALLEALLADRLADSDVRAGESDHRGDFSDRAAIRWHVAIGWHFLHRHRTLFRALYQAAAVDDRFADRLRELMEPDLHHLADHLVEARDAGLTLPGPPVVVAAAIGALVNQFAAGWYAGPVAAAASDDDEVIDTITSLIYRGIGGTDPP